MQIRDWSFFWQRDQLVRSGLAHFFAHPERDQARASPACRIHVLGKGLDNQYPAHGS